MAGETPARSDDHLLTPQNAVPAIIDYQPEQISTVGFIAHDAATSQRPRRTSPDGALRIELCLARFERVTRTCGCPKDHRPEVRHGDDT